LLGVDRKANTVTVLNADSAEVIAVVGEGAGGNAASVRLSSPGGAICDEKRNRIVISDTGNKRLAFFSLSSFAYGGSIATANHYATMVLDRARDTIFAIVTDPNFAPPGNSILPLDAGSLKPKGISIALKHYNEGPQHERAMYAYDLAVDDKND